VRRTDQEEVVGVFSPGPRGTTANASDASFGVIAAAASMRWWLRALVFSGFLVPGLPNVIERPPELSAGSPSALKT
jgi:hypothetical protein